MKFYLLSVVPILFSRIAFGAPGNDISLSRPLEINTLSGLFTLRRDTRPVLRDLICGKRRR